MLLQKILCYIITSFLIRNVVCLVEDKNVIRIEAWQYCAGCKALLEVYTGKASTILSELEKEKIEKGKEGYKVSSSFQIDAAKLADNICMNNYYNNYQPEIQYTCQMIMQDYRDKFLLPFAGADAEEFRQSKGNFFEKSKQICSLNLRACPIEFYERGNIHQDERTLCAACSIIGDDLEIIMNVAKHASPSQLVETVCQSLGFSHKPYSWIEDICEEMIDEHKDEIIETMYSFLRVIRKKDSDYNPYAHLLAEKMCKKLFNCEPHNYGAPDFLSKKKNDPNDEWRKAEL